jgi:Sec-independent protein translocase protein TatA
MKWQDLVDFIREMRGMQMTDEQTIETTEETSEEEDKEVEPTPEPENEPSHLADSDKTEEE